MPVGVCPVVGRSVLPLVLSVEGCRKAGPGMSMSPHVILYIMTNLALARR